MSRKLKRTDTYEELPPGSASKLAGKMMTPRGEVETTDAPGICTILVQCEKAEHSRVGVLLYDPDSKKGMIAQLDADQARSFAASFIRLANMLQQRKPH